MILLTGAAGYLGSHIFHEFKKRKIQLTGIDNFSTKNIANKYTKYILRIDINNNLKLEKIIKKNNINTIIHAAAFSHPLESQKNYKKYKINNIYKTKNFIKLCKLNNIKNFIFLTSSNVYSDKRNGSYKESDKTNPKNYYGKTKINIEKYLKKNKKNFKNLIFLRLFNIAGYYDDFRYNENEYKYKKFFNFIKNKINKNKYLKLYYYKKNKKILFPKRDFLHIKDLNLLLVKIIYKLKNNLGCEVYNVGSGKSVSMKDFVKIYENEANKKIKYSLEILSCSELKTTLADIRKVKTKYSWSPKYNIKDVIRSIVKKNAPGNTH